MTTQAILFALMYGIEDVLFNEIDILLFHIAVDVHLDEFRSLNDHLELLEALNKSRRLAIQHIEVIQRCLKIALDESNYKWILKPDM